MRIKQHGKEYKKEDQPKFEKFKCDKCGCIFTCDDDEYYVDLGTGNSYFTSKDLNITVATSYTWPSSEVEDTLVCSCPECHKIVTKIRKRPSANPWITYSTLTSTPIVTDKNNKTNDSDLTKKYTITCDSTTKGAANSLTFDGIFSDNAKT